uniref:Uncharacterized protein n=1 Tax=Euplotes harpa TaxID=151035 RepID=A0A7S3JL00_9SPIT|mmetsp:Transcript_41883/g.48440  ORF Transcript_41883/g.48440 Transcript_41883/m.48440 type:complete len:119 (+) Transcript_41883:28-384(+)
MSKESAKNNENEYLPLMDSYKEDDPPLVSAESVFRPHPYTRAGLISRLLFGWVSTLVSFGRTHKLQQDGIGEVCEGIDARAVKAKLERNWNACKHGEGNVILRHSSRPTRPSSSSRFS